MKAPLNQLRHLVLANIATNEQSVSVLPFIKASEKDWLNELPKIKEEVFEQLNALVLSKKNDRLIKRHVQQAQRECISLLDLLPKTLSSGNSGFTIGDATRVCLEEVLEYLLKTQSFYFNWEAFAPRQHVDQVAVRLNNNVPVLKAALKRKGIDNGLQILMNDAFIRFVGLSDATYQQLHYMETLQLSLIKLCHQIENLDFNEILMEHLIYYGFNENAFVMFCKQRMQQRLNQLYHAPAQYEQLCFFEKNLIAQQEKTNFLFSTHRKSTKTQLLDFVNAELNYFQKKQGYFQQLGGQILTEKPDQGYRIKVNLSADGLAYLLRLLCETEVIEANPRTQLMNFVARSFQTAGIGEKILSPQSLGTKYKQVTQSTATGMKTLLHKMLRKLEKDYF